MESSEDINDTPVNELSAAPPVEPVYTPKFHIRDRLMDNGRRFRHYMADRGNRDKMVLYGVLVAVTIIAIIIILFMFFNPDKWRHKPGYTVVANMDVSGNDILRRLDGVNNVEEMKKICNTDPGCKGFNSNGWFKNNVSFQTAATGSTLYVKK